MTDKEKEAYLKGYADAIKEHELFIKKLFEYINTYNYREAKEQSDEVRRLEKGIYNKRASGKCHS